MTQTVTPETPIDPDLDRVTQPDTSLTVVQALNLVMRDVTVLRKERRNNTGSGFNFRGIDDTMNALGPAFRTHGVLCVPRLVDREYEQVTTSKGAGMTVARVTVEFTFYGPKGDCITARTPGEAFDSGDKATAKAMSVALRTCLLQTFTLPTDEPDPDEHSYEIAPQQPQRRAERSRDRSSAHLSDPWRTDLTPDEKHALAALMREDDTDKLRAAWKHAEATQAECPELVVKPADITRDQAEVLGIGHPTPLKKVVELIGKHLAEEGISVRDHIAAENGGVIGEDGAGQ